MTIVEGKTPVILEEKKRERESSGNCKKNREDDNPNDY